MYLNDGKIYARATIDGPDGFASPFSGAPFPRLIWDHDGRFTDAGRVAMAKELLDAGWRCAPPLMLGARWHGCMT